MVALNNTGNSVPSTALSDFQDNVQVLDELLNSDKPEVISRTGEELKGVDYLQNVLTSLDVGSFTFSDTSAGISGTKDGQYFRVPQGTEVDVAFKYYLNNSGAAEEVAEIPSNNIMGLIDLMTKSVSTLLKTYEALGYSGDGIYPVVVDKDNNIILGYDNDKQQVVGTDLQSKSENINNKDKQGLAEFQGEGIYPVLVDENNNIIFGYDNDKQQLAGLGLATTAYVVNLINSLGGASYKGDGDITPIVVSQEGNIILGYDSEAQTLVGLGLSQTTSTEAASNDVKLGFALQSGTISAQIAYGQSLSTGVGENRIISDSQPYSNLTFSSGVRGNNGDFSGTKPLVEDLTRPTPDGQTDAGETICSGAANFASLLMAKENGIDPTSFPIFASTAGHGSYSIDDLKKGSDWYTSQMLKHMAGLKNIEPGAIIHTINWLQGEADGDMDTTDYVSKLIQLRDDISADAKSIMEQSSEVVLLTYQHSSGAMSSPNNQLALLEAAKESDYIFFVAPTYIFPHHDDNLHLTPEGYKWIGAYYGRAYKQMLIDGIIPKSLQPTGATYLGNKIRIYFNVPNPPLVLDNSFVGKATDYGFAVVVDDAIAIISSIKVINSSEVEITLAETPSIAPVVRYGFDYLGEGMNIRNGASGNLRDSNPDTCQVNGETRNMYHAAPHFKLTAITEEF